MSKSNNNSKQICDDCPGEHTEKLDIDRFDDLLQFYMNKVDQLMEEKLSLTTIGDRTLSKNREFQIENDQYLRDLAQIERLKVTIIYLLVCIGFLGLIIISIIPRQFGYILVACVLVAYVLTIVFINNNFYKRYNLNYSLFRFEPELSGSAPNEEPQCTSNE